MLENDISTLLLCLLFTAGGIVAAVNLWNYRKFKELKIKNELFRTENELLKFKLKECEQSRS